VMMHNISGHISGTLAVPNVPSVPWAIILGTGMLRHVQLHGQQQPSMLGAHYMVIEARLRGIERLPPGWNGYGAPAIEPAVITHVRRFLATLHTAEQPDRIVPTGRGGVQIEYEGLLGRYLEIEFGSETIGFLYQAPDGDEIEDDDAAVDDARALVHRYYAS
jgi:hypothetical protein